MCNERDERMIERFCGTICGKEDPVEISLYPIEPIENKDDIIFGSYPRAKLLREGVDLTLYEEFVVETWKVGNDFTEMRIRPFIVRQLSKEEVREIKRKIDEMTKDWDLDSLDLDSDDY